MIYEINHYMNCGNEIKWRNNCCSECNLCNCIKKEGWKKFRNPQLTCSQCLWLHSSVGRASHRYREVTGSNPVEVLNFFSGFFMQLHKLRSLRRSFLHFHFISAVHIWFISYIINILWTVTEMRLQRLKTESIRKLSNF